MPNINEDEVDAGILRRHFVAIATSDYDHPHLPALSGVAVEVATLSGWLCTPTLGSRQFQQPYPDLAKNPNEDQIRAAIRTPPRPWTDSDAVVLFVTGHGLVSHQSHWIALKETDPAKPTVSAIRTADLIGWITENSRVDHLLAVFDMCYAGATAADTVRLDADFPPTWLILASVTKTQTAATGALTSAIADFLDHLATSEGRQFGTHAYLKVADFLEEIQGRLAATGQRLAHLPTRLPDLAKQSPCLPNPHYLPDESAPVQAVRRDLALRAEDVESHWGPRSRGVATHADPGWQFTGRVELMRRLIDATTGPAHTLLVTGGAGSGKSAALARLVTLADPTFLATYAERVAEIPADLRPAPGSVDVAVLATGKLSHEVLAQITDAVGADRPAINTAAPTLTQLRTAWWTWLSDQPEPVTIVVDALDEASHPHSLLDEVLAQLEPPNATEPRIRLIVGVRSPSGDEPTSTGAVLADIAERKLHAARLRVDQPPLWNLRDVVAYVSDLLRTSDPSPYVDGEPTVDAVAGVIADKAGTSYLVARLAATSLASRGEVIDPTDPTWLAALDSGVVGVFRDELHTTLAQPDDRERAVHLLRAVAFAYGRGLPWYKIWPLVANAVADHPDRTYGDGDIAWLLDSRLGGYLVTDTEDDTTVYRLFHDALRGTLRERWRDLLT